MAPHAVSGQCPRGRIENPASGVCVLRRGQIGQEILAASKKTNMAKKVVRKAKKVVKKAKKVVSKAKKADKVRAKTAPKKRTVAAKTTAGSCKNARTHIKNPATNRCVLRSGAIGQAVLAARR